MSQNFDTNVALSAGIETNGQPVDFDGTSASGLTITNNSGISIQYSADSGATWTTLANGSSASPTVPDVTTFFLRKQAPSGIPVFVKLSWRARDSFDPSSVAITGGSIGPIVLVNGAAGDGAADDTVAIQTALNKLEAMGGGVCYLPKGTFCVSVARSVSPYACLVMPANVTFQGAGMGVTTITRLPSERGTDGVLIVNKGWDTSGGYGAAGNLVFQDFTITDGAAGTQHPNGDLIGLGHADNCIVQRVQSLNHDQHFVDITGSKRVKVLNCVGVNATANTTRSSADIQIDSATSGAIYGIFVDNTPAMDVEIAGNHFVNPNTIYQMHVGHKSTNYKNIHIHDNTFDGGYASGDSVIGCDNNPSFENVNIHDNILIVNHVDARGMNFFVQGNNSETIKGLRISGNTIKGSARVGIYAGTNSALSTGAWPDFNNLSIVGNVINYTTQDAAASATYGIRVVGFRDGVVSGNTITISQPTDANQTTDGIWIDMNRQLVCTGNTVRKIISSPTFAAAAGGITVNGTMPNVGKASILVANNVIHAPGHRYLLNFQGGTFAANTDIVVFSGNTESGTKDYLGSGNTGAHIFEAYAASDGTNFRKQVDFGGGVYIKTLATGQWYQNLPLPGTKLSTTDSILSPAKVDLVYAPNASTDFDTDVEAIQFAYMSATTCAGTQVADVQQTLGLFSILTGVSGVSAVLNNSTFQPTIRTTGYLKAFASL